jgi:hypothetical protein
VNVAANAGTSQTIPSGVLPPGILSPGLLGAPNILGTSPHGLALFAGSGLVGFLALLNGILTSTEVPAGQPQPTIPAQVKGKAHAILTLPPPNHHQSTVISNSVTFALVESVRQETPPSLPIVPEQKASPKAQGSELVAPSLFEPAGATREMVSTLSEPGPSDLGQPNGLSRGTGLSDDGPTGLAFKLRLTPHRVLPEVNTENGDRRSPSNSGSTIIKPIPEDLPKNISTNVTVPVAKAPVDVTSQIRPEDQAPVTHLESPIVIWPREPVSQIREPRNSTLAAQPANRSTDSIGHLQNINPVPAPINGMPRIPLQNPVPPNADPPEHMLSSQETEAPTPAQLTVNSVLSREEPQNSTIPSFPATEPSRPKVPLSSPLRKRSEEPPTPDSPRSTPPPRRDVSAPRWTTPMVRPTGNAAPGERGQAEDRRDEKPAGQPAKAESTEKSAANAEARFVPSASIAAATPNSVSHANSASQRTTPNLQDRPEPAVLLKEVDANTTLRPQPLREISLRLTDKASSPVDIQMAQRAGHVEVAVRTPDQELSNSLQNHLGDLVGRLEAKGYKTESWVPAATVHPASPATESAQNSNHGHDQPGNSGSWASEQQQGQDPSDSGHRQHARWINQIELSMDAEEQVTESIRLEQR